MIIWRLQLNNLETIIFDGFTGYEYGSKSNILEQYLQMLAIPLLGFTYICSAEEQMRERVSPLMKTNHDNVQQRKSV